MSKYRIVLKHEFMSTLKRKGFLITSLALPVLGLLGILVGMVVQNINAKPDTNEPLQIGYVDQVGVFSGYQEQPGVVLIPFADSQTAVDNMLSGELDEFLIIPADYINTGIIQRFTLKAEISPGGDTSYAISSFLTSNLLGGKVDADILSRVQNPFALINTVIDESGQPAPGQGGIPNYIVSYLFGILLLLAIFTASGYLLQGLSEEKENRIMEVLLSSVTTRELMTGKIVGLGLAGLIQVAFWLVCAWGLVKFATKTFGDILGALSIQADMIVVCLVFFILGYFLYSILMAAIGAITPNVRDGQQLSVIVTMSAAFPFYLMPFILNGGDNLLNKVLSLFPLTSPLTIIMRMGTGIPVWEIILAAILLSLTIWLFFGLAAKLFRVFLLMYGKTPSIKEIMHLIRQT
ncbi:MULTISPECIES: ABC transporter permease [Dehalococcoides]|jgi:ABC-type Na+ efflux pump, permease component|nr:MULTISPECIES: ABC transporter permease [Dehalococcoides]AGG06432.1 Gld family protein [Dehalococcoides mccartyi DCMB5]AGG07863.1 Gld family protein [Dehalococcoides mccartyi BTF08]AMU86565.1 ABC transporter permease [Dehalococcoides mccartyi]AOV99388.1 membrane protein [Dehalococcoides mccartyi]AQU05870.1 ABC transporter permease [Dehalococcoides mccartyi]